MMRERFAEGLEILVRQLANLEAGDITVPPPQGRCPEDLAQLAHELLAWRREAIRATTPPRSTRSTRKKKKFVGRP